MGLRHLTLCRLTSFFLMLTLVEWSYGDKSMQPTPPGKLIVAFRISSQAARSYRRVKRNCWPKVRGVAMNPVEHPHGGGNHQHIGKASTVARDKTPGRKVGLIAARRTGLLRAGFSHANAIIKKQRNRLNLENRGDLRLMLTNFKQNINSLAAAHQTHPSH
ncbi:Ribosomal protein L2 C-terminal [Trinorchestia longiramus]|nr:Ribosomal protein L2 C-terminal [Trinorchestia longiramus]